MTAPTSFTDTHSVSFADGARIETTTTYYPPPVKPAAVVLPSAPAAAVKTPPVGATPLMVTRLAGVHDTRSLASVKSVFPATVLTRPFIAGVQSGPTSLIFKAATACRQSWVANLLPTYSLKLNRDEVMAGKWDPYIRELANWHLDQPAAELILQHEPENDTEMQGGAFPPYFNHIAEVFRSRNTRVPLLYAAMAYQWMPGNVNGTVKGFTSNPAHWQGVEADLHTLDIYSGQTVPLATILPDHKGFQRWQQYVVVDRPWGISERGFITGTEQGMVGRAAAIRTEQNWLRTDPTGQRCRRYIYWNTPGAENNPAIVVDPKYGESAVRDLVAALNT